MQCPPTPGHGCNIFTRGCLLASETSSQTLIPSFSQMIESSLVKAMLTSRKLFSVSLRISDVRAVAVMQSASTKILYKAFACPEHLGVKPPMTRSSETSSRNTYPGKTRLGQCATQMSPASPSVPRNLELKRTLASQTAIISVVPRRCRFEDHHVACAQNGENRVRRCLHIFQVRLMIFLEWRSYLTRNTSAGSAVNVARKHLSATAVLTIASRSGSQM